MSSSIPTPKSHVSDLIASPSEVTGFPAKSYGKRISINDRLAQITVLTAIGKSTQKAFYLNAKGEVEATAYGDAFIFEHRTYAVGDISRFATLLTKVSRSTSQIPIRGEPNAGLPQGSRRQGVNFSEPESGCYWAMLDFDGIAVPSDVSPVSREAIEFLILKLPIEFRSTSYFYQFSSSAGILNSDGTPRKPGVSAHVFFWFDTPISGKLLAAWLRMHCINSDFYERGFDKRGTPRILYGIDESVLVSSVQPHYVALPLIGDGVQCSLASADRQGLVQKANDAVTLPAFEDNLVALANAKGSELLRAWKLENGCVPKKSLSRSKSGGVVVTDYLAMPRSDRTRMGRIFSSSEVKEVAKPDGSSARYATLYFEDESSPGSWYVSEARPTVVYRFGGGVAELLKEFSPTAYAHVRDGLQWIDDIVYVEGKLTPAGYLPSFDSFISAKNSLVLAPTSSGKTTGFCNYARSRPLGTTIVYAAQTRALTRQMVDDLREHDIRVVHYRELWANDPIEGGVYVTTNESLRRIFEAIKKQGVHFELIIDEAHLAIDDFMTSNTRNALFEACIGRATKTILMTGTLTDLQIKKISESVEVATGPLTAKNFVFHEFTAIHRHPLWWAPLSNFGADLVALMRLDAETKAQGGTIPRTVIIAPTSSLERYRLLLGHFGLQDNADVVSRTESTEGEIEEARESVKAWLITSPLFAIGLNFENPPARLWTSFQALQVDTSQIIQTVNRANRAGSRCEVRLYAGNIDATPPAWFDETKERATLEGYLLDEGTVEGVIDQHLQIDRMTYSSLRAKSDKNTAQALYQLKVNNSIQNYNIVEDWEEYLVHHDGDAKLYKDFCGDAREGYKADVKARMPKHESQPVALLLQALEKARQQGRDFRNADLVPKDSADEALAVMAAMTGNPAHVSKSQAPSPVLLRRLLADLPPFLSAQFQHDKTSNGPAAAAEKTRALVGVVGLLKRLSNNELDGISFGKKMRLEGNRRGVLALVLNENDYVSWNRRLEKLDRLHEQSVNASGKARSKLDKGFFDAAKVFLGGLGISFDKTKGADGRNRIDVTKPLVPNWDFDQMKLALEIQAEHLENSPAQLPDPTLEGERFRGVQTSLERCRRCVHCDLTDECGLGRPVQAWWDDVEQVTDACDKYVALSTRVWKMKPVAARE